MAQRYNSAGDTNENLYKDAADRMMKSIEYQQIVKTE